jgi:ABC-type glycerol-3-phosphate transport system substrate-binding protein
MKLTRLMLLTLLIVLVSMLSLTVGMAQDEEISGTLNILGFSLPDEIATVRVDQFREQYPDVEVNITEGALDTQQFLTSVVSGNSPDLIYTNRDDLSTFAGRGALMPLDECIANMGVDMGMYREAAVQQVTVDGQVYGIPEFFNVILLIANNAALEEAGLTVEDLDTSDWENITALNEALTVVEDGEVTRIGFDPKLPEFLPLWAMANGVSLISEDGRTAQLNDPAVVEMNSQVDGKTSSPSVIHGISSVQKIRLRLTRLVCGPWNNGTSMCWLAVHRMPPQSSHPLETVKAKF